MNKSHINYLCLTAIVLLTAVGCTSIPSHRFSLSKKAKTPARMVDVWNTYVQTDPDGGGGAPLRGLAGRIVFYPEAKSKSKKQPEAIRVDGTLSVFLFDAAASDPQHTKPLKQYIFKAEALPYHYSFKEPMGHGYNIFLPIDEYGGSEKTLSVIVRFDDGIEKGRLVMTQPVTTTLQGTSPTPNLPDAGARHLASSNLQQHSFTPTHYREEINAATDATARETRNSRSRVVGAIPLTPRDTERFGRVDQETINSTINTPNQLVWSNAEVATDIAQQQQLSPEYPVPWSPTVKLPFSNSSEPSVQAILPDIHYRELR